MATRRCRSCAAPYEYPVRGGLATRTHCQECALLDKRLRHVLEKMRRRMDRLAEEVQDLAKKLEGPGRSG